MSMIITVGDHRWLILSKFLQKAVAYLAVMKSAPSSVSNTDERTRFVIAERTCMASLVVGKMSVREFFEQKFLGGRSGNILSYS